VITAAKALVAARGAGVKMIGDPVAHLRAVRREVRLVRQFRATDALASGLGDHWLVSSSYAGASDLVKRILEQERLIAAERDPQGCILMNMHNSSLDFSASAPRRCPSREAAGCRAAGNRGLIHSWCTRPPQHAR
jgi:hypothetical protein